MNGTLPVWPESKWTERWGSAISRMGRQGRRKSPVFKPQPLLLCEDGGAEIVFQLTGPTSPFPSPPE